MPKKTHLTAGPILRRERDGEERKKGERSEKRWRKTMEKDKGGRREMESGERRKRKERDSCKKAVNLPRRYRSAKNGVDVRDLFGEVCLTYIQTDRRTHTHNQFRNAYIQNTYICVYGVFGYVFCTHSPLRTQKRRSDSRRRCT